ncbi:hypothetical protein MtrunA17_Chr8g0358291 [Medicago truncatula]|uniref:Uncharacterized protein n=1 Tax=Medicago truncatula TaxID=3880 RepID=A0A396GIF3_MEDTR|nr:hypothetical protein MtrunA17_Chr8g0358291 [Medicago truncatula]
MFSLLSLCIVTMPKRATVTRRESRHMSHQRIRSDPGRKCIKSFAK